MSAVVTGRPLPVGAQLLPTARSWRPGKMLLLALVLLSLVPPMYLLQTGGALTTGYEIQRLEKERSTWLVRNQQLEAEIARARSLSWVEHEAVTRLGMQRPAQTLVVRTDAPSPAAPRQRLLRRGEEPQPAAPVESGGTWSEMLGSAFSAFTKGN